MRRAKCRRECRPRPRVSLPQKTWTPPAAGPANKALRAPPQGFADERLGAEVALDRRLGAAAVAPAAHESAHEIPGVADVAVGALAAAQRPVERCHGLLVVGILIGEPRGHR